MSARKLNGIFLEIFFYVLAIFLLVLTSANLNNYFSTPKVLGTEVEDDNQEEFWTDFLSKNPDYIPGWIELRRWDKVTGIDPNYLQEP